MQRANAAGCRSTASSQLPSSQRRQRRLSTPSWASRSKALFAAWQGAASSAEK
jgi:hypothetical protein